VYSEKSPDDGQRNCPKHVEFYSKNIFEKLVHLVGFIIRTTVNHIWIFVVLCKIVILRNAGRNMLVKILWTKYIINTKVHLLDIYVFAIRLMQGRRNVLKYFIHIRSAFWLSKTWSQGLVLGPLLFFIINNLYNSIKRLSKFELTYYYLQL